jgi:hypothetical protein
MKHSSSTGADSSKKRRLLESLWRWWVHEQPAAIMVSEGWEIKFSKQLSVTVLRTE